jgi:hypothetical protein
MLPHWLASQIMAAAARRSKTHVRNEPTVPTVNNKYHSNDWKVSFISCSLTFFDDDMWLVYMCFYSVCFKEAMMFAVLWSCPSYGFGCQKLDSRRTHPFMLEDVFQGVPEPHWFTMVQLHPLCFYSAKNHQNLRVPLPTMTHFPSGEKLQNFGPKAAASSSSQLVDVKLPKKGSVPSS